MDQEHWQKVQRLFESALAKPPEEIPSWLEEACGDDPSLKAEVEGLLRSDAEAGSFARTVVQDGATHVRPRPDSAPLPKFGKYELEVKIGQGGFGVVYRGRDPVLGRHVALKTCSTEDGRLRRRFFREGRIAAGLQHPNVTTVHDLGVENGVPYLVQEFLHGEDLDHLIDRREPLPLVTKLDYLVQIARGLEYAHSAGVLHRDIKPGNVRVHESGSLRRIKIMDFGIARLLNDDTRLTGTGMAMGTVGYLAPEQLRGEEVDTRADVFSYGVLAYELLSYERPFQGENFSQVSYQLLYVDPPPLHEVWPQCPQPLAAVVGRCMEKEPARRYVTFTEVLEDLEPQLDALRTGTSSAAVEPTLVLPVPDDQFAASAETASAETAIRRPPIQQGLIAVALTAVLAVAAVLGWRTLGPAPEEQATVAQAETNVAAPTATPAPSEVTSPSPADPAGSAATSDPEPASAEPGARVELTPVPPPIHATPPASVTPPEAPAPPAARPAAVSPEAGRSPVPGPAPMVGEEKTQAPAPATPIESGAAVESRPLSSPESGPVPDPAPPPPARLAAADPPQVEAQSSETSAVAQTTPAAPTPATPAMKRGALLTPGPGVVAPLLLERPQPEYPERARRRRKEARVVVRVLVDENGRVMQAVAPAGDRFGFGAAAKQAALGASFEPATRDGIAGRMWTELPFEFKLK